MRAGSPSGRIVSFSRVRKACRLNAASARALTGPPYPLGRHLGQDDLIVRPAARRRGVHTDDGDPLTSFGQGHAKESRDPTRQELLALCFRESRVRADVADHHRLVATARVDNSLAEARHKIAIGECSGGSDGIRPLDDKLVALDLCVMDSARLRCSPINWMAAL